MAVLGYAFLVSAEMPILIPVVIIIGVLVAIGGFILMGYNSAAEEEERERAKRAKQMTTSLSDESWTKEACGEMNKLALDAEGIGEDIYGCVVPFLAVPNEG